VQSEQLELVSRHAVQRPRLACYKALAACITAVINACIQALYHP
jgi:hypothetical protein